MEKLVIYLKNEFKDKISDIELYEKFDCVEIYQVTLKDKYRYNNQSMFYVAGQVEMISAINEVAWDDEVQTKEEVFKDFAEFVKGPNFTTSELQWLYEEFYDRSSKKNKVPEFLCCLTDEEAEIVKSLLK